jgi:hypothetical protein
MSDVRHFVHQPGRLLRRYVREILWIRSTSSRTQILLPETALTLVLRSQALCRCAASLFPLQLSLDYSREADWWSTRQPPRWW